MTLQDRILSDMVQAMKDKNTQKLGVLRMVKAAFLTAAKDKPKEGGTVLSDEEVVGILKREGKKRKESAAAFTTGNRKDLADTELAELAIIEAYLPAQMSADAIRDIVNSVITEKGKANFGAVMGAVMQQVNGQADGSIVREVVNECMKA